MLNKNVFLAVDAGTSKIKAALLDEKGRILDIESTSTKVFMPKPKFCEMDMNDVWERTKIAVLALFKRNSDLWQKITAIGVCAQGDGAWMLDEKHAPVRNAILWNDTRTVLDYSNINKYCLQQHVTPLFPGASLSILKWLKVNEENNYKKVKHVLHCKDWINFKLTGNISTDETDASTQLLNLYTKEYCLDLLDYLDLGDKKDVFPTVLKSHSIMGYTNEETEEQLNIPFNTPVVAGAIDVLAVATGCGLTKAGQKGSILGTTLGNYVVLDEEEARKHESITGSVLCHTQSGTYIRQLSALSGAPTLDWVRQEILGGITFSEMEEYASMSPIGSENLIFHPYIYGERAPFAMGNACGGFFGIRATHTKSHLARSAYEGFALSMYDCYKNLPVAEEKLYIAGGASASNFICQLVCDCIGSKTYRFSGKELGIMGVYNIICNSLQINCANNFNLEDEFIPNEENHEKYNQLYASFVIYRNCMMGIWKQNI
ncbi:MAG: FGGY family carbohydrate kinase [Lachnospiraceae bacterium]|nr:FGGY family carbohydrate kinase [Lachnospiraceae bacterium]